MIRMKSLFGLMALGIGEIVSGSLAIGQTVERDTTITGPRGRTIKRQVEVQRRPGWIDRSVQIQRPGEHSIGRCKFSARRRRGGRRWAARGRALPGFRGPWWSARPCRHSDLACWPRRC